MIFVASSAIAQHAHQFNLTSETGQSQFAAIAEIVSLLRDDPENARKHGGLKCRLWRKIHIGIDEETLEIRAVEVTSSSIGDAPMLPDLLNQIPADEDLGSVTADSAFDTPKCLDAIAARNSHAVIPPRKNAKFWKADTPGAIARNEAVRSSKYLGRALWRHLTGYHR